MNRGSLGHIMSRGTILIMEWLNIIKLRTWASIARTAIYGGVAGYFSITQAQVIEMFQVILVAAMLADYATWLFRSLMLLPNRIWHGCYDSLVNILFGFYLFQRVRFNWDLNGSLIAVAFAVFMAVLLVKIIAYSYAVMQLYDDEED